MDWSDRMNAAISYIEDNLAGEIDFNEAAKKACSVVDECVGEVVNAIISKNGVALITADHGNSENMLDYNTNEPMTSHTTNFVWFSLVSKRADLQKDKIWLKSSAGKLADVIPTLIEIMGLEKPKEMTGESLIERF